ncbi:MAG: amidohydrolase family protein, partial [Phaeodactylibacter sp.]|nr:amidohydrolase family protein [Phaeodactylibacter sp.]
MRNLLQLLPVIGLCLLGVSGLIGQETFPYNGVADERSDWYALTGATIYTDHATKLENATLLLREGRIEAVGTAITVPKGAVQVDLSGKVIYPAFIDLLSGYGIPEAEAPGKRPQAQPQLLSNKDGAYAWNESLKPEFQASTHFNPSQKEAENLRKAGFGAVLTHQMDGVARGTGALVLLGEEPAHEMLLQERAANFFSFQKGVATQSYPNSLMGAIALLRQTYYDADWYAEQGKAEERNLSLEAWNANAGMPQVFIVGNKLEALRAAKLGKEFDIQYIIKGDGDSYQRIKEIKAVAKACIVPLDFPDAFDVEDPYDAMLIDMAQLKHWELAPTNPAAVAAAGIPMAITFDGLKSEKEFWENLRKAVEYGLSESDALKALTMTPAELLKADGELGSLAKGKLANFFVADKPIFDKGAQVLQSWVHGKPYEIQSDEWKALLGTYDLKVGSETLKMELGDGRGKPSVKVYPANDTTGQKGTLNYQNKMVTLLYSKGKDAGHVRLSGVVDGQQWAGKGQLANGAWVDWTATYKNPAKDKKDRKNQGDALKDLGAVTYPFEAFGWTQQPTAKTYLIKNATVWTNEAEGILENADVLIQNGKIQQVGKNLKANGAVEIDATGKHLTPGIIDEHSHIAVSRGVNEGTQASTAEVRIGDVINSDDVNIYRQLSGGVTTSQLLHGSANP